MYYFDCDKHYYPNESEKHWIAIKLTFHATIYKELPYAEAQKLIPEDELNKILKNSVKKTG